MSSRIDTRSRTHHWRNCHLEGPSVDPRTMWTWTISCTHIFFLRLDSVVASFSCLLILGFSLSPHSQIWYDNHHNLAQGLWFLISYHIGTPRIILYIFISQAIVCDFHVLIVLCAVLGLFSLTTRVTLWNS